MKDRNELPQYLRIADDLRAKLLPMPSGAPFETEQALTEAYGVSRGTIRQALAILEREGLLVRTRGRGSFRARPENAPDRLEIAQGLAQSIRKKGADSVISHLSITLVPSSAEVADLLQIPHGTKVRKVVRIRSLNGKPFAYCESYLRADLVPPFFKRDFKTSLSDLVQHSLQVHVESKYCDAIAAAADRTVADALEIPLGSPILKISFFCLTSGGVPFVWDVLNFPPTQTLHLEITTPVP